jgi:membrane protein
MLMMNIEQSFNAMWNVPQTRSFVRRLRAYFPFLLILLLVLGISASVLYRFQRSAILFLEQNIPLSEGLTWGVLVLALVSLNQLTLFLFYFVVPHIRVRLRMAALSALTTALLITGLFLTAAKFQTFLYGRYSGLYGSLALIPVMMVTLWASWNLILLGCAYCSVLQEKYDYCKNSKPPPPSLRDLLN